MPRIPVEGVVVRISLVCAVDELQIEVVFSKRQNAAEVVNVGIVGVRAGWLSRRAAGSGNIPGVLPVRESSGVLRYCQEWHAKPISVATTPLVRRWAGPVIVSQVRPCPDVGGLHVIEKAAPVVPDDKDGGWLGLPLRQARAPIVALLVAAGIAVADGIDYVANPGRAIGRANLTVEIGMVRPCPVGNDPTNLLQLTGVDVVEDRRTLKWPGIERHMLPLGAAVDGATGGVAGVHRILPVADLRDGSRRVPYHPWVGGVVAPSDSLITVAVCAVGAGDQAVMGVALGVQWVIDRGPVGLEPARRIRGDMASAVRKVGVVPDEVPVVIGAGGCWAGLVLRYACTETDVRR